ncbi:MAG: hypothetical protein AAF705_20470, partial [Bacteroidota bacterium]
MERRHTLFLLLFLAAACFSNGLNAQEVAAKTKKEKKEPATYKPMTVKLSDDGSKYLRLIMWHQIWATTNNLAVEDSKTQLNTSIRRSRILAYAQISPRFLILTHFGLNGLNTGNLTSLGSNGNAPQFFLHGAWAEFKVNDHLYMGGGLHYWKGLTRLSNQSTLNFMTLDQSRPFVHWHSLGITDQFARHLGIYAKGEFGKFDYRIAVNNPGQTPLGNGQSYGTADSGLSYTGVSQPDADGNPLGNSIIEGYFRFNLWDKESTKLPYLVGTYLGKKKVLALGTGFFAHPNGMYNTSSKTHQGVFHVAADAFMDLPTSTGSFNAYSSFMRFDYGDNYVSRWAGTGNVFYGHVGYFLKGAKIMPYIAYQNANYEGFSERVTATDIGINYFVNGHHAKLTLEYHRINNDPREGGANDVSQLR